MPKQILAIFDMDGTLIKRPSSWEKIHIHFNTQDIEKSVLDLYNRGLIDYNEFMRRDIAAWGNNIHISLIRKILLDYEFVKGAYELSAYLKEKRAICGIITAGIDIVANDVTRKLNFDFYLANGLDVDKHGFLTGEGILRVEPNKKGEILNSVVRELGIDIELLLVFGDSKYDIGMFRLADISIGLNSGELDPDDVDYLVNNLLEALNILKILI